MHSHIEGGPVIVSYPSHTKLGIVMIARIKNIPRWVGSTLIWEFCVLYIYRG